jgi:2-polyprenyl-6-hydroxyphenyl methylase / 3-demethylubiquinone-9 3-methyltransferase
MDETRPALMGCAGNGGVAGEGAGIHTLRGAAEASEGRMETKGASTVDPAEVERFSRSAAEWWDPDGEFGPLHRLNPARLGFIRDRLGSHFGRPAQALRPFTGLRLLDIGCGGGLVAEPMARLGFAVTAIDADAEAIAIAGAHAADNGLAIDYRAAAAEDVAASGARFDAVLALEIVEHVHDPKLFLATAAQLVAPGGALIVATINRTTRSFLFAIVGAEHVLRWVARGTHSWEKFLRPSELAAGLRPCGMALKEVRGLVYEPWRDQWNLAADVAVNYLIFAIKPKYK